MRIKGEPSVWTGDPVFDVVAAVYRQALSDAKKGDESAIAWLDMTAPDWRRMVKRPKTLPFPRSLQNQKGDHAHAIKNAQNRRVITP